MRTPKAALLWLLFLIPAATNACEQWAAMIVSVNGSVMVESDQTKAMAIQPEAYVCPGQRLVVGVNSRAAIYLSNNSFVRLDENTILSFPAAAPDQSKSYWVELKQGVSHFISRLTQRFEVKTPYTNAAVDGTEFLVASDSNASTVSVIEGQVSVSQPGNPAVQALSDGQSAVVSAGSQIRILPISATDTVDWAVYFPPLAILSQLHSNQYANEISQAAQHIQKNRADLAIKLLESLQVQDSAVQVALASAYVSVGKLEPAKQALNGLESAEALALGSLIATLTNQPQQALQLALAANSANGQSLAAYLALTYAYQANLDLNAALKSTREAAERFPKEFSVWARLSELQVATGDVGGADKSIQTALQLNDHDSSVLVQSGFIYLFNHSFKKAETQFKAAIQMDSENPQARLGLGLTLLRQGELEDGRKQLEFAVSLDPARSVLRSYLGRAYFEEHRDEEASVQWGLAKQMDPQDPTAYFYEGVRKLYANDPIGAIEELETSRKLNDERALYRSETLLQSDAASRSAALARAYDEVGYDQGVFLAGWDAIRRDPTNSEGHRLLADKYRGNSRYETARASELLQSQLWQPISAYPVQPQLAEANINLVEKGGPQRPGYNEYQSLFTQDGIYGSLNGVGGSDGTWADDIVGGFLAGPLAVSVGQYHYETDGWRDNTDQEQDIYSLLLQYELSPSTSLQFEARSLDWVHGNLSPYYIENQDTSGQYEEKRDTYRLGLKHVVSGNQAILVSIVSQNVDKYQEIDLVESYFDAFVDNSIDSVEAQYVFSGRTSRTIFGAGWSRINRKKEDFYGIYSQLGVDLIPDDYDVSFDRNGEQLYNHYNLSAYVYFWPISRLEVVLGGDFDKLDVERKSYEFRQIALFVPFPPPGSVISVPQETPLDIDFEDDQFSPKIGVSYDIGASSHIRAALFRTYARFLASSQTIEPTQFVGFNQFFDDENYSKNDNLGIGYDVDLSKNTKFGLSVVKRRVEFLVFSSSIGDFYTREFSESLLGAQYYFSPNRKASVSVGAEFSQRDYSDSVGASLNEIWDSRMSYFPIEVLLLNDAGWEFRLNTSYYMNRFNFIDDDLGLVKKTQWVTDISLEKRFIKQAATFQIGIDNVLGAQDELSDYTATNLLYYPDRYFYCKFSVSL